MAMSPVAPTIPSAIHEARPADVRSGLNSDAASVGPNPPGHRAARLEQPRRSEERRWSSVDGSPSTHPRSVRYQCPSRSPSTTAPRNAAPGQQLENRETTGDSSARPRHGHRAWPSIRVPKGHPHGSRRARSDGDESSVTQTRVTRPPQRPPPDAPNAPPLWLPSTRPAPRGSPRADGPTTLGYDAPGELEEPRLHLVPQRCLGRGAPPRRPRSPPGPAHVTPAGPLKRVRSCRAPAYPRRRLDRSMLPREPACPPIDPAVGRTHGHRLGCFADGRLALLRWHRRDLRAHQRAPVGSAGWRPGRIGPTAARPGPRVLDVGTGTGVAASAAAALLGP